MRRLLEPNVELELYDDEHVIVRIAGLADEKPLEIVLEDARWKELSRRRVTLRFNEWALARGGIG